MKDQDLPPSYSATSQPRADPKSPPTYSIPQSFQIGSQRTEALFVRPEHLKGHLSLLDAFYRLKHDIEDGDNNMLPDFAREMDAEQRWGWFVSLAVERFERWCLALNVEDVHFASDRLPPLDVAMVWHAYLLNPTWYAEDTLRLSKLQGLAAFNDVLINILADPHLLTTSDPSLARMKSWEERTLTPFRPFDACTSLTSKKVKCPNCARSIKAMFIEANGSGYAQSQFKISCPCKFEIDKEKLGVYKFVQNLTNDSGSDSYLAGTLHTPRDAFNTKRADAVKKVILGSTPMLVTTGRFGRDREHHIMEAVKYSLSTLRTSSTLRLASRVRLTRRIFSAYTDDRIFSIDLVGAVLRQGSFVKKMYDLNWTKPSYFDAEVDEIVLQHCVARYHAFLDLMTESPTSFFVPTLDIDLAWHSHQLMAKKYQQDCLKYIGRYVDHDDKVEEDHLATSFDVTCRAWQSRFSLPYMYCGCPLPGDTIGQKMKRLIGNQSEHRNAFLRPPSAPEALAATHPSDHNAVYASHNVKRSEAHRKKRLKQTMKRREKGLKKTGANPDVYNHSMAFLYPVPMYYYAEGGCVAVSGGLVDGGVVGSCAIGAGGGFGGGCGGGGCGGGGCGGGGGGCGGGGCGGGAGFGGGFGGGGCGGGGGGGGCGGGGCGGGGGGGGGCGGG